MYKFQHGLQCILCEGDEA